MRHNPDRGVREDQNESLHLLAHLELLKEGSSLLLPT